MAANASPQGSSSPNGVARLGVMNEITIRPEMTYQEYCAYQDALMYGSVGPIFFWTVLAIGAASSVASAALTWASPASLLAGLAFASVFFFGYILFGQSTGGRRRKAYQRYSESETSYIFTNDLILATSRYVQSSIAWAAVDRVLERRAVYLLAIRNSYICVPKRAIPPDDTDDFIQLLRTRHLLS